MLIKKDKITRFEKVERPKFEMFEKSWITVSENEKIQNESLEKSVGKTAQNEQNTKNVFEEEINKIKEQYFHEGYQQGEKAGFEMGVKSIQPHIEKLAQLIKSLTDQHENLLRQSEETVMDLIFKIVEKILGENSLIHINIDREKLQNIVKDALNHLADSSKYQIRMNKDTAAVFEEVKPQILEKVNRPVNLSVMEDPLLKPGECIIESENGVIDARFDTQLKEIRNIFKNGQISHGDTSNPVQ